MRLLPNLKGPKRTLVQTLSLVVFMVSLSYASVPFYDWFCRVTGFGGVPNIVAKNTVDISDKTIKVRFDASLERDMPWSFKPEVREMEIKIGETGLAFYEAYNPLDVPIAGQASYNVTPYEAGAFFDKIDCFCFTEQVLMPGETMMMPVSFYVDPQIIDDRDAKFVHTITLSYTFYQIDLPDDMQQAALTNTAKPAIEIN